MTGGQSNLQFDLGTIYHLDTLAPTAGSTTTWNLSTDLSSVFGTYNRPSGVGNDPTGWSVFGANTTPGSQEVWTTCSSQPQDDLGGTYLPSLSNNMAAIYRDMNGQTATFTDGGFQTPSSDTNSFYNDVTVGATTTNWGNSIITGNVQKTGDLTSYFALYDIVQGDSNYATEVGKFKLSGGTLTYTDLVPQSVPEPSTWASIVLGAASLLAIRRRRA